MSKAIITEQHLHDIADAIIAKGGATAPMTPAQMPVAIAAIPSGSSGPTIDDLLLDTVGSYVVPTGVYTIKDFLFSGNENLSSVELTDVTTLRQSAFAYCDGLTTINTERVTTCGNYAFRECSKLREIDLSSLTGSLPTGLFYGCSKLVDLVIGSGCTAFNQLVFSGAFVTGAKCRILATNPPSVASSAYLPSVGKVEFYVPDDSVEIYKSAQNWSARSAHIHPISEYPQGN